MYILSYLSTFLLCQADGREETTQQSRKILGRGEIMFNREAGVLGGEEKCSAENCLAEKRKHSMSREEKKTTRQRRKFLSGEEKLTLSIA